MANVSESVNWISLIHSHIDVQGEIVNSDDKEFNNGPELSRLLLQL